jgi:benzoate membrane transport protein
MSPSLPALAAGLLAGFVGFASGFPVFLQGLRAMGASPAQAASGLTAIMVAMGLCGIVLSLSHRMPISVGQSTPGAALLASSPTPAGGFDEAVGAFLAAGALAVLVGLWRPLGRAVAAIPAPLANAMLAGVLLGLCLAPVRAVAAAPMAGLAILLAWAVTARLNRLLAVPAAVLAAALSVALTATVPTGLLAAAVAEPLPVVPRFSTAVLQANGYRPAPGPLFAATGLSTVLAAPFGGHAVNVAPMITALCAGEEAGPDPARRWQAAAWAGVAYLAFGLLAGAATRFAEAAPPVLVQGVAGLALLGAFASAMQAALSDDARREAAVLTFLVTASGLTLFGISGAFWGLLAGVAMLGLARWR